MFQSSQHPSIENLKNYSFEILESWNIFFFHCIFGLKIFLKVPKNFTSISIINFEIIFSDTEMFLYYILWEFVIKIALCL